MEDKNTEKPGYILDDDVKPSAQKSMLDEDSKLNDE
jgi:hypothetical protein